MQLPFFLALLWGVVAQAYYTVNVLTSKTVTCTTQFGTTSIKPVPRDVTKTTIVTSTTLYVTSAVATEYTTPEITVSTTTTEYSPVYVYTTVTETSTSYETATATGCPLPLSKKRAEKRDAAVAFTTALDGVVYRLYPTSIMCTKTISILSQTTSFVGGTTTITADKVFFTITATFTDVEPTYVTEAATTTVTQIVIETDYPDCKPPANSSCTPYAVCGTFVEYECESGFEGFGTYSCDCGLDATGVGACFENTYCTPYIPCAIDDDCPTGQGCWTNNCCGYSICAAYDVCGAQATYDGGPGFSIKAGAGLTAAGTGAVGRRMARMAR